MTFIAKPDGSSFRPIALTFCMNKLFETLIKDRLQWWAETFDLLPPNQNVFRADKSCTNNLSNLALTVREAFLNNMEVLASFLDVKGAFDNVCIDILREKLADIGCPRNLIEFIHFITHSRVIHAENLADNTILTHKGVPKVEYSVRYFTLFMLLLSPMASQNQFKSRNLPMTSQFILNFAQQKEQ